jgi:hydroxylamine dehydrogenase
MGPLLRKIPPGRGALLLPLLLGLAASAPAQDLPRRLSEETEACLECHATATAGIVADWERSRHARTPLSEALARSALERRVSVAEIPDDLGRVAVGCAECHMLDPEKHADTFDHNGFTVHTVVSPQDCAVCHPVERAQYAENLMSAAHGNLTGNPLFHTLETSVIGPQGLIGADLFQAEADSITRDDACLVCHGTQIAVRGEEIRKTSLGDMDFPVLAGWPNQGAGRVNPDGSRGACTACHTRHQFAIAMARQPATCGQCHRGPDVPALAVYQVSKHGGIYETMRGDWDFEAVPWTVGRDFTAPTCAACHISLLAQNGGDVLAPRTHRMNDRLAWRLFGLPYAHPHPKSVDTTPIRNRAGMSLPTELTGEPVAAAVVDTVEMTARRARLETVCGACHATGWVEAHFARLERSIATTNGATLAATQLLQQAWDEGYAAGADPFDEPIEKMWVEQWLFHANSTRFASAMAGADYGVFAGGRWDLARNLRRMREWLESERDAGVPR